jgi:hypothetical protein
MESKEKWRKIQWFPLLTKVLEEGSIKGESRSTKNQQGRYLVHTEKLTS